MERKSFIPIKNNDFEHSVERMIPSKHPKHWYLGHLCRYNFALNFVTNKIILDAGCGPGYGSYFLSKYANQVVGIDIGKEAVIDAKKEYVASNLQFSIMDIPNLALRDNVFETICSFEVIEHLNNQEQYLGELLRVLIPGGYLILSTPNKKYTAQEANPFHVNEFDHEGLITFLGKFFDEDKIELYGQRLNSKTNKIYTSRFALWINFIKRKLRMQFLLPHSIKRLIEKLLTGTTLEEASLNDYVISKDGIDSCTEFVVVCRKM